MKLRLLAISLLLSCSGHSALSTTIEELGSPTGEILLSVSGAVECTNMDGMAQFDLDLLQQMPQTSLRTSTIWTDGEQEFTGVLLSDLLETLCVEDGTLQAQAINDYAVEIPVSDATEAGPIVAYAHNGQPMSVRDRGPLWIIYPYDSAARFRTEVIYSRSIWQLDRIEVSP